MSAACRVFALVILAALSSAGCVTSVTFLSPNLKLHIVSLDAAPDTVAVNGHSELTVAAENPAGGKLTYAWGAAQGSVTGEGSTVSYYGTDCCLGSDMVVVIVKNEKGETDTRTLRMTVLPAP